MAIKFKDLKDAFDLMNFGDPHSHEVYICKETGKTFYNSEYADEPELLPDDIESDKYILVPHKSDFNLGKRLVLKFAALHMEGSYDEVDAIFRKRGAYSRFKYLLEEKGLLDEWYKFEQEAQEQALRDWCEAYEIEISG